MSDTLASKVKVITLQVFSTFLFYIMLECDRFKIYKIISPSNLIIDSTMVHDKLRFILVNFS